MPSPATTCSRSVVRYAMRVSARVPPQRGKPIAGRASCQCTRPVAGSIVASSLPVAATTKSACGDHAACEYAPSRLVDPSAATTQVPPAPLTRRRPGAGSWKSAGCAPSMPIDFRTAFTTARPGAESAAAATATTAAAARTNAGRTGLRAAHRGLAPHVRLADDRPGALLGVGVDRHLVECALHVRSPSTASCSRSSPRRRRELTVPRGRSRMCAISPGVYSSR